MCVIQLSVKVSGATDIRNLSSTDTVYIMYSIAYFGEYGGNSEGVIIYRDNRCLKAMYVKYNDDNYNYSTFNWNKKSIIDYFTEIKSDHKIIKDPWVMDTLEIDFINDIIADFNNYTPENCISNAGDFYFLNIPEKKYIVMDRCSDWDKYKEIHQCFGIKVEIPKRIYFLGIKVNEREVKYITK